MKRNILATVSAAALLLAAGNALAANTSTVNQDANSTNVAATINQKGTGNDSAIDQTGADNSADVLQKKTGNKSKVTQGQLGGSTATVQQTGNRNDSQIDQTGLQNSVGSVEGTTVVAASFRAAMIISRRSCRRAAFSRLKSIRPATAIAPLSIKAVCLAWIMTLP